MVTLFAIIASVIVVPLAVWELAKPTTIPYV